MMLRKKQKFKRGMKRSENSIHWIQKHRLGTGEQSHTAKTCDFSQ